MVRILLPMTLVVVLCNTASLHAQATGTVVEADRPQAGLEVVLADKDGKVVAKTKTGEKGTFEFKDVAAGSFVVSSAKPVTGRKGSAKAERAAGKTVDVKISLLQ